MDLVDCNYRLVSNLTFVSKLMEKVMLHQIEEHLDLNMLNITYQLAYKKYHSCETALIKFMHDILWNMEKGKITTSIAIDLSFAFDTVDHYILIQTLEQSFRVHSVALNWFKEYLHAENSKFVWMVITQILKPSTSPFHRAVVQDLSYIVYILDQSGMWFKTILI